MIQNLHVCARKRSIFALRSIVVVLRFRQTKEISFSLALYTTGRGRAGTRGPFNAQ